MVTRWMMCVALLSVLVAGCGGSSATSSTDAADAADPSTTTVAAAGRATTTATASSTTTTVPVGYGPRPEGLVADFPEILIPLPVDPAVRQTASYYLFGTDPLGMTLEYEGAAIDRKWCLRYFDRVQAGGISKTTQFEDNGDLVFIGSNAAHGVRFVLTCEPTGQLLEVVQMGE